MVIDVHNALFEYNIFIRWKVSSILHLFFYGLHYWLFVQITSSEQINPKSCNVLVLFLGFKCYIGNKFGSRVSCFN
jgi:hypothetical protein